MNICGKKFITDIERKSFLGKAQRHFSENIRRGEGGEHSCETVFPQSFHEMTRKNSHVNLHDCLGQPQAQNCSKFKYMVLRHSHVQVHDISMTLYSPLAFWLKNDFEVEGTSP